MTRLLALCVLLTSALVMLVGAPGAAAGDTPCMGTLPPVPGGYDNVVVPPNQTCLMTGVTVLGNVKALEDSRLHMNSSNVRGNVLGDKADSVEINGGRVRENIIIKEGGPAPFPQPTGFFFCLGDSPCEAVVTLTTVEEGSIQIEKMQGTVIVLNAGILSLNPIRGNVQVKENVATGGEGVYLQGNRVTQNMQVEDNVVARAGPPASSFHGLTVDQNTVGQNLQVYKNRGPGTKVVSNNTVQESLQCFDNDLPFTSFGNFAREAQGQCTAAPLP